MLRLPYGMALCGWLVGLSQLNSTNDSWLQLRKWMTAYSGLSTVAIICKCRGRATLSFIKLCPRYSWSGTIQRTKSKSKSNPIDSLLQNFTWQKKTDQHDFDVVCDIQNVRVLWTCGRWVQFWECVGFGTLRDEKVLMLTGFLLIPIAAVLSIEYVIPVRHCLATVSEEMR